ncbi:hypothetical protein [Baekduia sp. Peel2402]|uniref:hypothetical protein n=1 Tax=Baekduia sp. Peel2402 TaxID=3458296 RepID=UPI00403E544B
MTSELESAAAAPLAPILRWATIVLDGQLNPAIYHPSWLTAHELLRAGEMDRVRIEQADADFTRFEAIWFTLEASRKEFELSSTAATTTVHQLRDLTLGIFKLLSHTPISAVTMRQIAQCPLDVGGWESLANSFSSLDAWSGLLGDRPRLGGLSVCRDLPDLGGSPRTLEVTLEPSALFDGGAYIIVSERIYVGEAPGQGANEAMDALSSGWLEAMRRASEIVDGLQRHPAMGRGR